MTAAEGPTSGDAGGTSTTATTSTTSTTATVVVRDASCLLAPGTAVAVPIDLTSTDARVDVVVRCGVAPVLDVRLVAPDDHVVVPGTAGAEQVVADGARFVRLRPSVAAPSAPAGRWTLEARLDGRRATAWLEQRRGGRADAHRRWTAEAGSGVDLPDDTGGPVLLPLSVTVAAHSSLRLDVELSPPPVEAATSRVLRAHVTDAGRALGDGVRVEAHLTAPDGGVTLVPLVPDGACHTTRVSALAGGPTEVRVVARGVDHRGARFTREEVRTIEPGPGVEGRPTLVLVGRAGG